MTAISSDEEIDERNAIRDRRALDAARRIVETRGLSALTRDAIADEANLSAASVSNFGRTRISNGDHARVGYRDRILRALAMEAIQGDDVRLLRIVHADGLLRSDDIPMRLRAAIGV